MNDPSQSQYANPSTIPSPGEVVSALPITGTDLVALIIVAVALSTFGALLWWASRPHA